MSSLNCPLTKHKKNGQSFSRTGSIESGLNVKHFSNCRKPTRKKKGWNDWLPVVVINENSSLEAAFKNAGESQDEKGWIYVSWLESALIRELVMVVFHVLDHNPIWFKDTRTVSFECGDSAGRVLMSDDQMIGCDKTSHHHKLPPKSLSAITKRGNNRPVA